MLLFSVHIFLNVNFSKTPPPEPQGGLQTLFNCDHKMLLFKFKIFKIYSSYRGMADNCRFEGETVRHFNAGKLAVFEMRAPNCRKDDIQVNIISK